MEQGTVRLRVCWDGEGGRIVAAGVDCRRPQAASLLVGRAPAEALALVPRLFSLCARAQAAAAQLAAAAAAGRLPAVDAGTTLAVAREAIGEHLWRLLLDWPALLGEAPAKAALLDWRKRLLTASSPADNDALGAALLDWLPSLAAIAAAEPAPAAVTALLPWQPASAWAALPIDAAFAAAPTWAGRPAETGALARRHAAPPVAALLAAGQRVAARHAARLADLDFLARGLRDPALLRDWLDAAPAGDGVGLARVETARGLLLHLMQVKDERVARYVIVAPTEWNFHPQGAFAGELAGAPAASREQAALIARRLALALDPCVNYEVVVADA
ncbi:MAG TPA: nickel-dependent hydrogenase large subunit [Azospira sp.]|nr:nickel-dependent hydrogenase large subunit [Azospira sp.]